MAISAAVSTPAAAIVAFAALLTFPSPAFGQSRRAHPFEVVHYEARIEPDIASRTVAGRVIVHVVFAAANRPTIELDSGDLRIDEVRDGGTSQEFVQANRHLVVRLSRPARARERRMIDIRYHGAPRFGMQFFPERSQVYTQFSTSQWLPCRDAPDERSTLDLTVVLPAGLAAAGSGRLAGERRLANGLVAFQWREDRPMPTYTFGFASGRFTEVSERRGRLRLRYLADGFSQMELRRVFRDAPDMVTFFEERSGIRYQGDAYTQLLVVTTIGQEVNRFALMSEAYGRAVLDDATTASLAAHELAHQWWGNMVTCRDWTHFWLNEGFATFMAAAYQERRFGRDAYLRAIEQSRARYEKVRDAGHDRPLVFPNWDRPTADDRTIVYQKGAYVLHLLRERLGDRAFWEAIRHYTQTNFGQPVTTADFERAVEQSSGADLSDFFRRWVF